MVMHRSEKSNGCLGSRWKNKERDFRGKALQIQSALMQPRNESSRAGALNYVRSGPPNAHLSIDSTSLDMMVSLAFEYRDYRAPASRR